MSVVVKTEEDLIRYLTNPKIVVFDHENVLGRDVWLITYQTKDEYVVEHDASNLVLALW